MIGSVPGLLLVGLMLASSAMALLWVLQVRIGDDQLVRGRSRCDRHSAGLDRVDLPTGLLFLLFRVTGIPATERQALRSRVDYAEYQESTSVFVPRPPRRR